MNIEDIFSYGWPEGLEIGHCYTFRCNDECPEEVYNVFNVTVRGNGDVYLSAVDLDLTKGVYDDFPTVLCRKDEENGRHRRTRQALLLLAEAIRLDAEELDNG